MSENLAFNLKQPNDLDNERKNKRNIEEQQNESDNEEKKYDVSISSANIIKKEIINTFNNGIKEIHKILQESHSEKNIKEFFLKSFKDFGIITKIFDITTDNASNNNTFFEEVSNELAEKNIEFDNVNQHVYYLTYIINLTTQKAFKSLKAIVNINENEFLNQYEIIIIKLEWLKVFYTSYYYSH
ncbi:hypothetical protein RhiirA4_417058 [Rhizophagus irregularis]|uniref:Uncharacterized protein n=1 Tax=Rhizophagus irregularis TaxID=588596 RepID=A0A2I1G5M0_9GLOM|nr:hypothetical protein RhiirA4_417058 [Rhizophagus irregularis]